MKKKGKPLAINPPPPPLLSLNKIYYEKKI
jgi:hypothetical protein